MKHVATLLALAFLAACAGPGAQVLEDLPPRQDLQRVDRAVLAIEAAELLGQDAALRQQLMQQAAAKPADPAARFLALYARHRDEATWAEFKAMSIDTPDSGLGWVGQARIYVKWHVWDQLDKVITSGFEAEPDNWLLVIPRAEGAEARGRFDAAATDWKIVLKVDPKNPQALLGLARAARRAGDAGGARSLAETALQWEPTYFAAMILLAETSAAAGDKEGAAGWYAKAVAANPKDRPLRITVAKLLAEKGDAAGARDQWKVALELKEDPDTLAAYAAAARAAGDTKAEERAIERLSAVDPGAAEWKRVAEIRLAAGDVPGAEAALRRSLARDAKDAGTNAALARLLVGKGEIQAAMECYRLSGDAGRAERTALEQRLNIDQLKKPDVAALQKAAQALIEKTYRARLAQAPNLAGTLKLRATVDANGLATQIELQEDTLNDPEVRACAFWNLRDASYPPAKPGRYSFSFTLRPPR
jgi:thioredoxin-like negative regulator of GroEL